MEQQNTQEIPQNIPVIKIPPNGLILKLMPVGGQKNLQKITDVAATSLGVNNSVNRITTHHNLKIYDDSNGNAYKLWKVYMPGDRLSEDNQNLLLNKYVDLNDVAKNTSGGRSSRKKYKKSSKRKHGRSMKLNASSNSKKYSRCK